MRNVIRKLNQKAVKVKVYNTSKKVEETLALTYYPDVADKPELPKDCIMIEETIVLEREISLKMTSEDFIKHATIIE